MDGSRLFTSKLTDHWFKNCRNCARVNCSSFQRHWVWVDSLSKLGNAISLPFTRQGPVQFWIWEKKRILENLSNYLLTRDHSNFESENRILESLSEHFFTRAILNPREEQNTVKHVQLLFKKGPGQFWIWEKNRKPFQASFLHINFESERRTKSWRAFPSILKIIHKCWANWPYISKYGQITN